MNFAKPIAAILTFLLCAFPAVSQTDYMEPELRAQVEQLKRDVAAQPSTQANVQQRTRVFWNWTNAYSLTGTHMPVNATQVANSIMALLPEERATPGLRMALDNFVREFTVRDENPNALGSVSVANRGPFVIDTWQTVGVTYTVGEMPIVDGGVILLGRHFRTDNGLWQHGDPAGDNYISVTASDSTVSFEPTTVPVRGMHGGFRGAQQQLAFKVMGGMLSQRESLTITYGDKSGGSRGFKMQSYSIDAAPLPLYIDFDRSGVFFTLPEPTVEVVGREVYAVHGFVPSIVAVGEKLDVSIRSEDEFYNRATGRIPELRVSLNGRPHSTLPANGDALQYLRDVSLDKPGVYRFAFASPDGRIKGTSDPIWVQENPRMRVYWGETHGHCGFAEGQGSADSYFTFGRDDARLDFLTLSEHDIWMDDAEWKILNTLSKKYTKQGKFIAFPGYEWTSRRNRGGHHNVFFRGFDFDRVPSQDAPRLSLLYQDLHAKYDPEDVLVIPHAHQAGDWRNSDVYLEQLVEIMSAHGTFEWFGDRYLKFGHQVGFIAASDDHLSHPGYSTGTRLGVGQRGGLAAVYSPELTSDGVFDALRNRQTYATSGARIILDANLNGFPMGTRQPYAEERIVKGTVMGTAPIASVALIKNGDTTTELDFTRANLSPHSFVQVNFGSESEAFGRDNPRGYRTWNGHLTVSGATLKGATAPGFHANRTERIRMDETDPNTVHFNTATRGRINNLLLELDGASKDTKIEFKLTRAREYGTAPVQVRKPANLPAEDVSLSFGVMKNGEVTHAFAVGRHTDRLSLKVIDPNSSLDQTFEFGSNTLSQPGDYYYLRVRQTDGALAWSSPFWVGGETPR